MKKKRGFTLVELLAVIVILAVILIIAMPKISDVIKNSKESSLETTAKLIASQAEKKYTENQVLDGSSVIKCSDVAKISNADYESCNITFDSKGNAKVTIVGKGKFEGMAVCDANKNSVSISSECSTDASYFTYEDIEDGLVKTLSVTVEDANRCKNYFTNLWGDGSAEDATTLCSGNALSNGISLNDPLFLGTISQSDYETMGLKGKYIIVENVEVKDENKCKNYFTNLWGDGSAEDATTLCNGNALSNGKTIQKFVVLGYIPLMDYETAGLNVTYRPYTPSIKITGYNIEGGTDVVIPSQIYGKAVVAIGDYAFCNSDASDGLGITSVVMPNTLTSIGDGAFVDNQITSITLPDTPITLGCGVFEGNPIVEDSSYSFPSNVTVSCVKN